MEKIDAIAVENFKEEFNEYLDTLIPVSDDKNSLLTSAMRYSLLSSGKRLRPFLMILTAKVLNIPDIRPIRRIAAAIEMLHTYSLIHDDLPALDNDDYRRGVESCHKKYGEAIAILSGNALMSYAFELIATSDFNAAINNEIITVVSRSIGWRGTIFGQALDLMYQKEELSDSDSVYINSLKTGKLFSISCVCPSIVSGSDSIIKDALNQYGNSIGKIIQVMDDICDNNMPSTKISEMKNLLEKFVLEANTMSRKIKNFDLLCEFTNFIVSTQNF